MKNLPIITCLLILAFSCHRKHHKDEVVPVDPNNIQLKVKVVSSTDFDSISYIKPFTNDSLTFSSQFYTNFTPFVGMDHNDNFTTSCCGPTGGTYIQTITFQKGVTNKINISTQEPTISGGNHIVIYVYDMKNNILKNTDIFDSSLNSSGTPVYTKSTFTFKVN